MEAAILHLTYANTTPICPSLSARALPSGKINCSFACEGIQEVNLLHTFYYLPLRSNFLIFPEGRARVNGKDGGCEHKCSME